MPTIDPNNLIFSLISELLGNVVTSDDYQISDPITKLGQYNTEITLRAKLIGSFYVKHIFRYNRIDITNYSPIYVQRSNETILSQLLESINNSCDFGKHTSISYLDKTIDFTVDPLLPSDIIDTTLPIIDSDLFLQLNPKSYLFIGAASLNSITPPVFISFDVSIDILPPVFISFDVEYVEPINLLTTNNYLVVIDGSGNSIIVD